MRYVLGGLLILSGAALVGLAYNNRLGDAWAVVSGKAAQLQGAAG